VKATGGFWLKKDKNRQLLSELPKLKLVYILFLIDKAI